MDWNGDLLAYATDTGVGVLTPIPRDSPLAKNLPSDLQQEWCFQVTNVLTTSPVTHLRFTSKFLVMCQENRDIIVMDHLDGKKHSVSGADRHLEDINSIDVSEDGHIVSCGDDRRVVVWGPNGSTRVKYLDGVPTLVKFWTDKDLDKVIVVEDGSKVKVWNWRKDEWLYTIYPECFIPGTPPSILDIVTNDGNITVIGDGSWKQYVPAELEGGAGYTFPNSQGRLKGWGVNKCQYLSSTSNCGLIGGVGTDRSFFYNLFGDNSGHVYQFKLQLPCVSVPAGSINHNGVVAFASGSRLVLIKPFETYEAVV